MMHKPTKSSYITNASTINLNGNSIINDLMPKSHSPKFCRKPLDTHKQPQTNKHIFHSPKKVPIQQLIIPIKFYSPKYQKQPTQSFKIPNPENNTIKPHTISQKFHNISNNQYEPTTKNIDIRSQINDQSGAIFKLHSQISNLKKIISSYQKNQVKFTIKQKQYQQKIYNLQSQLARQIALKDQIMDEIAYIKKIEYQVNQLSGINSKTSFQKINNLDNKGSLKQQALLKKIEQLEHENLQLIQTLNKLNQNFKYQKIQLDMLKKKKTDIVNLQIKNLRLNEKNKQLQTSVQKCKIQLNKAKTPQKNKKVPNHFSAQNRKKSTDSIFSLSSDQSLQEKS